MDIKHLKEPLTQFLQQIPPSIKVNQVIIFGSYLEGQATAESDVDVLVISDDFKRLNEDERLHLLQQAADRVEPIIDPWGFTNEELERASELTLLGYARTAGIRFPG